jgi:hypothetical protein
MLYKRKQNIVDKKFQLGTTFSVIGVSLLIVVLIGIGIVVGALKNNKNLSDVVTKQDEIVQALVSHASTLEVKIKQIKAKEQKEQKEQKDAKKKADKAIVEDGSEIAIGDISKDHLANLGKMKRMVLINFILLGLVGLLVLIQGIVLYFMLIRKTHQIAGPIFVISRYMREIISGKIPAVLRPLRKRDELKAFYELFGELVEYIKNGKKVKKAVKTVPSKIQKKKKR